MGRSFCFSQVPLSDAAELLIEPGKTRAQRELGHLLRFAVVGGLSVAVDLGVFWMLNRNLGWLYPLAKGCSYAAGMALGFGLNKWWAFGSRRSAAGEAPSYVILYAATLGLNMLTAQGVRFQAMVWGLGEGAAWVAAFVAATGLSTVLNYLGLRFITFRRGIAEQEASIKDPA
jgi:putative flippase GtrA